MRRKRRNIALQRWWFWSLSALFLGWIIATAAVPLQDQTPELKRRQQELRKTRKIIQRLQRKLETLHQKERHLTTQLGLYQKQLHYVGQYIELLQQEIQQLQWAIAATHMRYDTLQQKLEQLRAAFRTVASRGTRTEVHAAIIGISEPASATNFANAGCTVEESGMHNNPMPFSGRSDGLPKAGALFNRTVATEILKRVL